MSEPDPVPASVEELLVELLEPEPGSLRIEDSTAYFEWVSRHRIWMGYNHRRRAAAIADRDGELLRLTSDDLGPLTALLIRERGEIPGGLSALELAEAVRRLTRPDPMGHVGDEAMLDFPVMRPAERPGSEQHRLQQDRELGSRPALLVPLGAGSHRLEFYFWTQLGGLEHWTVDVRSQALEHATVREMAKAGTYSYPFI